MTKFDYKTVALILAGGSGSRMKSDKTKQRMTLGGSSILWHSVKAFDMCEEISSIVVVVREDEVEFAKSELSKDISKPAKIVIGGNCRAESARNGFLALPDGTDFVAIHDAARCLIKPNDISLVVKEAYQSGAATAVCAVYDTLKSVDEKGFITGTIDRQTIKRAMTPQVFKTALYKKALAQCHDLTLITDDNMLVESIGVAIKCVEVSADNIKITDSFDLEYAKILLGGEKNNMCNFRIGHGYDVHRLTEGRKLILGGVDIPHEKGCLGHSDADVLVHAIMDALIGALGCGDIGKHFPDTDDKYKGISSLELLRCVKKLLDESCAEVVNIDATLVIQRPKIAPYILEMRSNISAILNVDIARVNIKATTEEKLGFTGNEDGASAHAVCLIQTK